MAAMVGTGTPRTTSRFPLAVVALVASLAFFVRLGSAPLNDWDEAWHAEVSREILTTGDWLTLHYRGDVYFNKPPLTFWARAVCYKAFGVSDRTARLPSACCGWASVVLTAWLAMRWFGGAEGLLAGFILCGSWVFTTYHAGRSGETDSALVLFNVLTLAALWQARSRPRWFYSAGVFTALGWMTKGGATYLPWAVAVIVAVFDDVKPRWRHALGGFALAIALASPWQIAMLARHGRAFIDAFYVHEAMTPTMSVSEGHGGPVTFHLSTLQKFFEPWLSLATIAAVFVVRGRDKRSGSRWAVAWAVVTLAGCSLIPTKLVWYAVPAVPPLAMLAGCGAAALVGRREGWLVLAAAGALAGWHYVRPSWIEPPPWTAFALILAGVAAVAFSPSAQRGIGPTLAAALLAVPLAFDGVTLFQVIAHDSPPEEWMLLREPDEPWRIFSKRLAKTFPDGIICVVGFPQSPAAEFYLRRAVGDARIQEAAEVPTESAKIVVIRVESVNLISGFDVAFIEGGLAAMGRKSTPR